MAAARFRGRSRPQPATSSRRSSLSGSMGSLKTRRRIAGPSVLSWIAIAFEGGRRGWRRFAKQAGSRMIDQTYRPGRRGPGVWRRWCCSRDPLILVRVIDTATTKESVGSLMAS
jgi:hypothetical protein